MKKCADFVKNKMVLIVFALVSFFFAFPSILYLLEHKTIYEFELDYTYFFKMAQGDRRLNAIALFAFFSVLFLMYFQILKKRKQLLETPKKIFAYIIGISILFTIIIPYTSKDIYAYIANGWTAAHYGVNPYDVSVGEVEDIYGRQDQMLQKVADVWRYEKLTYGPLWALISRILVSVSFGNVFCALIIFKMVSLGMHIVNCVLIYKITKKNLPMLLYGLNPVILFEDLSNVHNDFYMTFFILLGIYFVTRKKNLFLAVASIGMATAIKYVPILLLPFIVIYGVRQKEIKNRIKICFYCVIEYVGIMGVLYSLYFSDFNVFFGLFLQQDKYNSSLFYLLYKVLDGDINLLDKLKKLALGLFAIAYSYIVIKLLIAKKVTLHHSFEKYNVMLLIFTFVLITNFNSWYLLWIFPTMVFLKGKSVKNILYLSYVTEFANVIAFALLLPIPYFMFVIGMTGILDWIDYGKSKRFLKEGEKK